MHAGRRRIRFPAAVLIVLMLTAAAAADQSSVKLDVPSRAARGSEITVTVHVFHQGNNFFHFTDGVVLKAGDKEIARWAFEAGQRPESENFSRQVKFTVNGTTVFTARANCNVHGSAGPASATVRTETAPTGMPAPAPGVAPAIPGGPAQRSGRDLLGRMVLGLGVVNFLLICFQVASGRRWIRVTITVHRRSGQVLLVLAAVHGLLAVLATI